MTKYQINSSGQVLEAEDAEDLVGQLHELSYAPLEDDVAWMKQAAEGATEQTGKPIRYDTAENFVEDMLNTGLIHIMVEGKKHGTD